jgi:DNA helicase-2/ATP-dependent DNA helicase PcrA
MHPHNSSFTSTSDLNLAQHTAVVHHQGPLLVLAGAGSGKTRVVTRRIAHLIATGAQPHQIIALTFTNKAAAEMRERLEKLINPSPWISTFHSFGLRILREFGYLLGLEGRFVLYDPDDCEKLMKQLLKDRGLKVSASSVLESISLCKNKALSPKEVSEQPSATQDFLELDGFIELYSQYETNLLRCQAVDFDDLLFLCVKLFKLHPYALETLQERWHYFLIDEYQDTNFCQYEMMRLLANKYFHIFAVGDPDQSIYSWRGADISNILNFERDFPNAVIIKLEENYRSTPQILTAASALIANNTQRYEKKLVSCQTLGKPVELFCGENDRAEAQFVAQEAARLIKNGLDPHQIAIFYRTNFQSRSIEDALRMCNLPYRISGGLSFYQRKEIKDILAYLRFCIFDHDQIAFERAISAPKRGIGDKTLSQFLLYCLSQNVSLVEGLKTDHLKMMSMGAKAKKSLESFGEIILNLRLMIQNQTVDRAISLIIEHTHYMKYLSEQEDNSLERMENLNELIAKAMDWQDNQEQPIEGIPALVLFLEEMNLGPKEVIDSGLEAITLMTVHNAKGLEFDAAFIIGLEEMLFPHVNHKGNENLLEEERRLMYVGMTRARKHLYLCCANSRFLWGSWRVMRPSRFIHELPMSQLFIRRKY